MKYTVDYFIQKFEAIPDYKWIASLLHAGERSCALGHCGCADADDAWKNEEAIALSDLLRVKFPEQHDNFWLVSMINDGHLEYEQGTPKARILSALHDVKKLQQSQHEDIIKDLAVLPVDETADIKTPVLS
jgi:hypothetical protein